MKIVISAGVLLLAAGIGQVTNISPAQTFGNESYTMAMTNWEKSEGVRISPSARDAIASSFKQRNAQVADFGGDRTWKGSDRTLKQTLVIYYLSDLRDLKAGGESRIHPTPVPMIKRADFRIEVSDVIAYPVEKFLDTIQPVLKGPSGELHVTSDPTGAAITLDKTSRGNTEKITVETAGKHRIIVSSKKNSMRCEDDIKIPAEGSVTFHCP
jgi:PEGA domain